MDDVDDDDWKVGIGGMLFVGWASLEIVEGGWFAWKVGLVLFVSGLLERTGSTGSV